MTNVSKVAQGGGRSTAAVLWLMILLVFIPIGSVHLAARFFGPPPEEATAADGPAAARIIPGSRAR